MEKLVCPDCGNKLYYFAPPNLQYEINDDGEIDYSSAIENDSVDCTRPHIECENINCIQNFMVIRTQGSVLIIPSGINR